MEDLIGMVTELLISEFAVFRKKVLKESTWNNDRLEAMQIRCFCINS
jgi:hypothetical protein